MSTRVTSLLIGGELREGAGAPREVINPATGAVLDVVRDACAIDLDVALNAARSASVDWSSTSLPARAGILRHIAADIEGNLEALASTLVAEVGKPIREAEAEARGTAGYFRYFASLLETLTDEIRYTGNAGELLITSRRSHGVVGAIIPWNYPAALVARKVAPAIAAGNAVVLKPDERTPLSALLIASILARHVPAGVVNVVCGDRTIGEQLVADPRTAFITMTGSPAAGREILRSAATAIKPVSLELGGKAPFIVMGDADLDRAVRDCVASRHANCGQVCIAAERVYVDNAVYDEFVDRYVAAVSGLRVGDPANSGTDVGPKVSIPELAKSREAIEVACRASAHLAYGGDDAFTVPGFEGGYWMQPAVLTEVTDDMRIMHDESFGPVTPIARIGSWEEGIAKANDSRYGLSAYLYTNRLDVVRETMTRLRFGELYVNRIGPEEVNGFHTGYGDSGLGGDDGPHGLDEYFLRQTVYLNV